MDEKEISLGRLFIQEAIRAATWGIVFLVIMGMFIMSIKQDIKEGIAYGIDRALANIYVIGTDPYLIGQSKQLIKEGIEYTISKAGDEAMLVLKESQK